MENIKNGALVSKILEYHFKTVSYEFNIYRVFNNLFKHQNVANKVFNNSFLSTLMGINFLLFLLPISKSALYFI